MDTCIWFDITNVPHVHFFKPIISYLSQNNICQFSLREFAETKALFEKMIGAPYYATGSHKGGNKIKKLIGLTERTIILDKNVGEFDIAIGVGNTSTGIVAHKRKKPSISFDDNDCSANWLYSPFTDLAFWPDCIPFETLKRQGFKKVKTYQYHGYKEDIYLADYEPNPAFLSSLPFKEYVVVRPENLKASYVCGSQSIVPHLLEKLKDSGINVLFLPRYESDKTLASNYDNVYVPDSAINGLDACYYAYAVLTGAGTMAREAACLGVPAISFYAGKQLLKVDQTLIEQKKMFFSRDVSAIMNWMNHSERNSVDLQRCKNVQNEVLENIDLFIERYRK